MKDEEPNTAGLSIELVIYSVELAVYGAELGIYCCSLTQLKLNRIVSMYCFLFRFFWCIGVSSQSTFIHFNSFVCFVFYLFID